MGVDINTLPLTWYCPTCVKKMKKPTPTKPTNSAKPNADASKTPQTVHIPMNNETATTSLGDGKGSTSKGASSKIPHLVHTPANNESKKGHGSAMPRKEKYDDAAKVDGMNSTSKSNEATVPTELPISTANVTKSATASMESVKMKDAATDQKQTLKLTDKAASSNNNKTSDAAEPTGPTSKPSEKASSQSTTKSSQEPPSQKIAATEVTYRKQSTKCCTVDGCPDKGKLCSEHGKLMRTCRIPDCNNFPQGGVWGEGLCVRHGAKVKRCNHEGCDNQVVRGGFCNRHSKDLSRNSSHSSLEVQATSASPAVPSPPKSFRLVQVPDGVAPGEVFHVLLGDGRMMGTICPKGVQPGDEIIVLEPGRYEPPLPPIEIAKINERHLLRGIDTTEHTFVSSAFWEVLWPSLVMEGWSLVRQLHFNFGATKFFAPGSQSMRKTDLILNVHYFDTIKGIRIFLTTEPKYDHLVREFEVEIVKRKQMAMLQQEAATKKDASTTQETTASQDDSTRRRRRRISAQMIADIDSWKCLDRRERIGLGRAYQVQTFPKAGTHQAGEEAKYM